jgi:putative two-component system response regulator
MQNPSEKRVILSIDDMPSNLIAIKSILEPLFDVRLAKSGEQGLALLLREKIDLVLLDIEMPGYDGFEFLQSVRENPELAHIPVIFVTTHASASFVIRAASMGAQGYILKPLQPSLLIEKVLEQFDTDEPSAHQDNILPL